MQFKAIEPFTDNSIEDDECLFRVIEIEYGFVSVRIKPDYFSDPLDSKECYTVAEIEAWRRDEWRFISLIASFSCNGIKYDKLMPSLHGIQYEAFKEGNGIWLTDTAIEVAREINWESVLAMAMVRQTKAETAVRYITKAVEAERKVNA